MEEMREGMKVGCTVIGNRWSSGTVLGTEGYGTCVPILQPWGFSLFFF